MFINDHIKTEYRFYVVRCSKKKKTIFFDTIYNILRLKKETNLDHITRVHRLHIHKILPCAVSQDKREQQVFLRLLKRDHKRTNVLYF